MALTDTEIRKSRADEKPYKLSDQNGLYLLVTPTGGKLWRYKFRVGGRERLLSIGQYPVVTLSMARERHLEARRSLAQGVDPSAAKQAAKVAEKQSATDSFAAVFVDWFEQWKTDKTPRHAASVKRCIEADILPKLGTRPVADIEAAEIVATVKAIEARGVGETARRRLENISQVMRYAVAHSLATRNPAADIRPTDILKGTKKENYARVDARELPGLLRSIEAYQGGNLTRIAMKLMAFTFLRTGELTELRWSEVDIDGARIEIAAARMKTRKPHIVPLSRRCVELLHTLHVLTGRGEYVFPNDFDHKRPMSNGAILMALRRMGYARTMTGHGFRGIASTLLHEQGFNHDWIELQLAHAPKNATSAAYNHALYLTQRRDMMQRWSDYLDGLTKAQFAMAAD